MNRKSRRRRFNFIIYCTMMTIAIISVLVMSNGSSNEVAFQDISELMNSSRTFLPSEVFVAEVEQPKEVVEKPIVMVKAIKKVVSRGNEFRVTEKEKQIMIRIVEAEATEGNIEQKMNIAQVIINRIKDDRFPDDVKSVVFAKRQFSPVDDSRYYSVEITQDSIDAVNRVLESPNLHNALFFKTYDCYSSWFETLDYQFKDGIHKFYR